MRHLGPSRTEVWGKLQQPGIGSYEELICRSHTEVEWFTPYNRIMDSTKRIPWTEWYLGGRLSITPNCLDRHAQGSRDEKVALIAETEDGLVIRWSYAELASPVAQAASAMRASGIRRGDTVGVSLPMIAEAVTILLACFKIGAIVIPNFSGFAQWAVAERLREVGARLLFTSTYALRRGKRIHLKVAADEAVALTPSTADPR